MFLTKKVERIINHYQGETPSVKAKIATLLMHGKLSGTGKMVILPVDQGFEHGPTRSFHMNPEAYNPEYHVKLAIEAGLTAYAAPKGMLEAMPDKYRGTIPLILKANSANLLLSKNVEPYQSLTASLQDALYLGCVAVGYTIYPGSDNSLEMIEMISELISEAKSYGLATVVWSYPRGGSLSKEGETAIDTIAYASHIAALMGANIIKVKPPSQAVFANDLKDKYDKSYESLEQRISHVMHSTFCQKRLVVFSGGESKNKDAILNEVRAIQKGGGSGSIIGRNSFQRPYDDALSFLNEIVDIYLEG